MRLLYKSSPMESLRKWFYKPKRDDHSLLAQFFFADDALNMIATELDSFDGRKDPERCTTLVNQLRHAQDRVLNITSQIMDQLLGDERVARGFRVKFPEDVLQDNLAGQLWFGAECLAAGSSIMNREEESAAMRPLAKALTRSLETVRSLLREQCLRPRSLALSQHDDMLQESLRIFDRLFAEFELCYVSAMVNVKTPHEFEAQQLICVLFSESLRRALKQGLLTQEQVDSYDPALMFAVPRLAIVSGLLIYSSGPLSIDKPSDEMSDMFRPFRTLLHKIRSLLWTLDRRELMTLERLLCTNEDISNLSRLDLPPVTETIENSSEYPDIEDFVSRFYAGHSHCRDVYTHQSSSGPTITEEDYLPDNIEVMTPIIDGLRRLSEDVDEENAPIPTNCTSDSTSTDTFQINENKETKIRRTSRTEHNDLASLRNLSTNGLTIFDPLVMNVLSAASTSNEVRLLPDHDLVSSLNEQVTEIADRLSAIVNDVDMLERERESQTHSFSTNDMPVLISTEDSESFGFSGPRNEQLSSMPSTSHGYLIPNAISHEPVVLASLSHNNSAVFNEDDNIHDINGAILNSDLQIMIPDDDVDIVNSNICKANANLSSLLLTNEEFKQNFKEGNEVKEGDNSSFHSAEMTLDKEEDEERVKFMLGYDSDHESPVDSGVSTDNTSLDRSPDTDQSKDIKENYYMEQNRVLGNDDERIVQKFDQITIENSFSNENNGDVTVNINIIENDTQKNEAGSSSHIINNDRLKLEEGCSMNNRNNEITSPGSCNSRNDEYKTIEEVITGLRKQREADRINSRTEDDNNERRTNVEVPNSSQNNTRQKKSRKSNTKSRKKKSKMWSPGIVILDNRSTHNQNSPLKLNLDHFVDDSNTSECADDEQIALALQAQELAARQQARGKFKSSEDLLHRLFVCIAGVADQLQTNFAADLRNILKAVFVMNQTPEEPDSTDLPCDDSPDKVQTIEYEATEEQVLQNGSSFDSVYYAEEVYADSHSDSTQSDTNAQLIRRNTLNSTTLAEEQATTSEVRRKSMDNTVNIQTSVSTGDLTFRANPHGVSESASGEQCVAPQRLPEWVPDIAAPACMRCAAHFTAFRRRHHCRHCGKVFCASCSSNSIPLPRYGQLKPVRVCDECFLRIARDCRRNHTHQTQR